MARDRSGLFLVFEGVEGAGKSSHLRRLSRRLDAAGIAHLVVREPGGTPAGERIRDVVLDPAYELTPEAELLLYLASRAEFVANLVRPALSRGELVLSDRFALSTLAYQGVARGLGVERARELNAFATRGLEPDGTILLTVSPDVGRGRKHQAPDRLERELSAFHEAVARAYEEFARADDTIIEISSTGDFEAVHEAIWDALSGRWPDRFPRPD
ncbi:MAG: dTMP kinase [Gemmatimonadota bacterium]